MNKQVDTFIRELEKEYVSDNRQETIDSERYTTYARVLYLAQQLLDEGLVSDLVMDVILAKNILKDINLFGLKEDNMTLPLNDLYFYVRTTDGLDNMKKVIKFIERNDSVNYPLTKQRIIQAIVRNGRSVDVNCDYNMVSSNSIDKFNEGELVQFIVRSRQDYENDLDKEFYSDLSQALKKHRYDDEVICVEAARISKKRK